MKKTFVISIFLVVLCCSRGWGNTRDHFLGFGLSVQYYELNESLARNQTYRGIPLAFEIGYEHWGASGRQSAAFGFNFGKMVNGFDWNAHSVAYSLAWAYEKKVVGFASGRGALYMGGGVSAGSTLYFYDNLDESHGYWLTGYSLDYRQTLSYRLSPGSRLTVELSVPVMAAVSRPPARRMYKTDISKLSYILRKMNEDLTFTGLNKYAAVSVGIRYRLRMGERLTGLFSYDWDYTYCRIPEDRWIKSMAGSLSMGLLFRLGKRR